MSSAASYSKLGYLMLKKESSAGTAIFPTTAIEILSESLMPNWDLTPVNSIAGNRSVNIRPVKDKAGPFEGTIELYVEPKLIGHFLCGLFGEDTHITTTAGVSETSVFQPLNTLQSYTMDIKIAGKAYVTRYFGVRFAKMTWTNDANIAKVALDVMAQRVFTNARLTVAHASGTTLDLDQTSGLTTSDSLLVLDAAALDTTLATLTISSITTETQLQSSTIGASLDIDDVVVIKAQDIDDDDYAMSNESIWAGGAEVQIGFGSNAMQRLAAKTNCESFELTVENDLEARWAATGNDVVDRMPATILAKGVKVSGKIMQFHQNPEFMDVLRQNEQFGLRVRYLGNVLAANSAVAATGVIESSGAGIVTVTADSAGEPGNDFAIIIVQGTTTLSAAISGKLITVTLDADAGDNTVALVAAAIDALSGVSAAETGSGNVTVADNDDKIHFSGGRDASERELVQIDLPNVHIAPFHPNLTGDDTTNDEMEFTAYRDSNDEREIEVRIRNTVTAY